MHKTNCRFLENRKSWQSNKDKTLVVAILKYTDIYFSNGVPERFNQVHGTQPTEIWCPFYYLIVLTFQAH